MTAPCDLVEREGLLDREDDERVRVHIAECRSCRALWEKHQRIRGAFAELGAAHAPRSDFEARMLAAIARDHDHPRRRWQWALGLGTAAAVAALVLLFLFLDGSGERIGPRVDGPRVAELRIEVIAGQGEASRTTMPQVGDILHIQASAGSSGHGALRIYRNDSELVLQCPAPADARCRHRDRALTARLMLDAMGRYQVVWLTSNAPVPEPGDSLERDVARAVEAGAEYALREIEVR